MNWQLRLGGPDDDGPALASASDPAQAELFRAAMRRFATTVSVISCARDGHRFGMAATAVTSLSTEPPALLVCVNKSAATHQALSRGGRFCVNVLHATQMEVSRSFSGQLRGEDRFNAPAWRHTDDGLPYLADAQANLFCETERTVSYATHTIFIARVAAALVRTDVEPLIYQDGAYAAAVPLPS